jgi:hypothetical protein
MVTGSAARVPTWHFDSAWAALAVADNARAAIQYPCLKVLPPQADRRTKQAQSLAACNPEIKRPRHFGAN